MRRSPSRFLLLAVVGLMAAAAYQWWTGAYEHEMEETLRGDLREVRFRPQVDREMVSVVDLADVAAIRDAVIAAHSPSWGSYPGANCDLEFLFADGHSVKLKMSATGITAINFFGQTAETFKPDNYVMLMWNGDLHVTDARAFNEVLRKQNRFAAPPRVVNSLSANSRIATSPATQP